MISAKVERRADDRKSAVVHRLIVLSLMAFGPYGFALTFFIFQLLLPIRYFRQKDMKMGALSSGAFLTALILHALFGWRMVMDPWAGEVVDVPYVLLTFFILVGLAGTPFRIWNLRQARGLHGSRVLEEEGA